MGLLDEAIREHLELKRRRGADPTQVAREESEALAPIFPDEHASSDHGDEGGLSAQHGEQAGDGAPVSAAAPIAARPMEDVHAADLSHTGQETAELDMQAVMQEDAETAEGTPLSSEIANVPAQSDPGEASAEEQLDWDVASGIDDESVSEEVPGQERLSFE